VEQVMDHGPAVVEVTDDGFVNDVLEESRRRPVVVDFWAEWCAPCRQLSPVLEKVAEENGGDFLLAKMDVDANPMVAGQFGIRSIPTVIAFADGRPVDSFMGAMPEPSVREWIARLLPTEADRTAGGAEEAEREGRLDEAEAGYREALGEDPANRAARLGLARVQAARGELDAAEETLKPLEPDPDAERLLSAIRVARWSELDPGSADLVERARAIAGGEMWREALDGLLAVVRDDPDRRPEARQAMLDIFAVLGDDDPIVREYRGKLASALF
jgi:putative thioredoxin